MTSTKISRDQAEFWVGRWDAQQERYVPDREERFAVIGDVVEEATRGTGRPMILDLGCGPGSLAARLADRLPRATVIGLDADPLLLEIARGRYPAVRFVDVDLADRHWPEHAALPPVIDAAVSTTALHWLDEADLATVYREVARRLRPGGVLVNGDHLALPAPELHRLARHVRDRRAARAGVTGNEEWSAWWAAVRADSVLAPLLDARSGPAAAHAGGNGLSVERHRELLLDAGFRVAGTVWQSGDDQVLVGLR